MLTHAHTFKSPACSLGRWHRCLLILPLLGTLISCGRGKDWEPELKPVDPGDGQLDQPILHDYPVVPLTLESRQLAGLESFTLPGFPTLRDGMLIVVDGSGDPYLHLLDPTNGLPVGSFGRAGEGPGEFGSWPQILKGPPDIDGRTWLFDHRLRRLTAVGPWHPDGTAPVQTTVAGTARLISGDVRHPVWTSRGELLVTLRDEDPARWGLAWFTADGITELRFQAWDIVDDRFDSRDLASAYAFAVCQSPDRTMLAVVHLNTGAGFVVNDVGHRLATLQVPIAFRPMAFRHPITRRLRFFHEPAARRAYSGCDATRERIYAVFSGALQGAIPGRSSGSESHVHVFDWSGQLQSVLRLDHGANSIAIDTSSGLAYTTTLGADGESPSVRVTQLPREP